TAAAASETNASNSATAASNSATAAATSETNASNSATAAFNSATAAATSETNASNSATAASNSATAAATSETNASNSATAASNSATAAATSETNAANSASSAAASASRADSAAATASTAASTATATAAALSNSGITPGTKTGSGSMAIGSGSVANGDYANAVGTNAKALADNATALGANTTVMAGATNSVALGQGSVADRPNTVSVGSKGNERTITNVAPGEISATSTDAVNGSQLYSATQGTMNELASTNTRVDRVGAMSAAMASLKPYYVDGTEKGQIMAGVGVYHGEKALALGYGYAPNDRLFLNASVGIAKEEQMYGMGATWRIGAGESLVKKNNQAMDNLKAENEELQDRVAKLEALVQKLVETKA
ncbi:YadA-like family protein, partial [Veillonella rogosae]|uniref:YadA-like family protein n=1 Tax=Veillonella rogosae TaxID=423477 RepID=UPI00352DE410